MIETNEDVINSQDSIKGDKRWCVYCHTNKENGKKYIGITSKNPPELRWENGFGYRRQIRFWNAIQKYGWDGFDHKILFNNLTLDEANHKEVELIAFYKSAQRDYGYNIDLGGNAMCGLSEEVKRKLSISHTGLHEGEKNNFYGVHMNGSLNPFYGKRHSEKSKNKMKQNHYDASGSKNPACRPVYCIELDEIFWGAKEAQDKYGVPRRSVRDCCVGKQNFTGLHPETNEKLHWKYVCNFIQRNGNLIQGAITLDLITQKRFDEYLNSLNTKEND